MILAPPPSPAITSEDAGITTTVDQVGLQNTVPQMTRGNDQVNERNGNPNNNTALIVPVLMDPYQQTAGFQAPLQQAPMAPVPTDEQYTGQFHHMATNQVDNQQYAGLQQYNAHGTAQLQGAQGPTNSLALAEPIPPARASSSNQPKQQDSCSPRKSPRKRRIIVDEYEEGWEQDWQIVSSMTKRLFLQLKETPDQLLEARHEIVNLITNLHRKQ